jgi:sigma-B regulation protein RsbU (phosphoserine phosphatase)
MPIGLIDGAVYDQVTTQIAPGDRLVLVSDGFTECPLPAGRDFGEDGLIESLQSSVHLTGSDLLEAMIWDLTDKAGTDSFPDDVSGIVLDLLA